MSWCYDTGLTDRLPRNLKTLSIKVPVKAVKVFSVEEVKQLLGAATTQTRLFILLALNIGATSKDISDLHPKQVRLDEGVIVRKRSKTSGWDNVPMVCYRLWPEVVRLLRIHASGDPERFLLTANNTALVPCELTDDGGTRRRDAVARAFRVVQKATGIEGSFKLLRKTGASLLGSQPDYQLITGLYLGHSPRGIGERHYLRPPEQILADGLAWLGSQFLPTTTTATPRRRKPRKAPQNAS